MISPIPQLFMYDAPHELTTEFSRVYNNSLVQLMESSPETITALGTVPLHNPEKAAMILQEAINSGLKGVIIGPGLPGYMLSDDYFKPFLKKQID